MRGDRARARGVANAEADADRQRDVPADLVELARDVARVEMARAGDALQRDVIDVAAREPRDALRCAPRASSARSGRSARCRARAAAPRTRPLPRADSRRRCTPSTPASRARSANARDAHRLDRIRVAHQHDRRRRVAPAKLRDDDRARRASPTPCASARSDARWITGPSAIGSENGTPSSMMSAPACDERVA